MASHLVAGGRHQHARHGSDMYSSVVLHQVCSTSVPAEISTSADQLGMLLNNLVCDQSVAEIVMNNLTGKLEQL